MQINRQLQQDMPSQAVPRDSDYIGHVNWLDFNLYIESGQGGKYTVRARTTDSGEAHEKDVSLRFSDEKTLKERLVVLQKACGRRATFRRKLPDELKAVQDFGRELFDALFTGAIRGRYEVEQDAARRQKKRLRLKLCIEPPELGCVPWEYLYDPRVDQYICLSPDTPLVRYIELPEATEALEVVPPLRILGMVASPSGPGLDKLDIPALKQRVNEALKALIDQKQVELIWMAEPTCDCLRKMLDQGPWHIFHFIGHGGFSDDYVEGYIVPARPDGQPDYVFARNLGDLLVLDRSLRLVLLDSCESGRSSPRDRFSSAASILIRRRIPAVVAMQDLVSDEAASTFTSAFYESIAKCSPVELAVTQGRVAMKLAARDTTVEWGIPVLYMHSSSGILFRYSAQARDDLNPPPSTLEPASAAGPVESEKQTETVSVVSESGQPGSATLPGKPQSAGEKARHGIEDWFNSLCKTTWPNIRTTVKKHWLRFVLASAVAWSMPLLFLLVATAANVKSFYQPTLCAADPEACDFVYGLLTGRLSNVPWSVMTVAILLGPISLFAHLATIMVNPSWRSWLQGVPPARTVLLSAVCVAFVAAVLLAWSWPMMRYATDARLLIRLNHSWRFQGGWVLLSAWPLVMVWLLPTLFRPGKT